MDSLIKKLTNKKRKYICCHCEKEIRNEGDRKILQGNDQVLVSLNNLRNQNGQPILPVGSIICKNCYSEFPRLPSKLRNNPSDTHDLPASSQQMYPSVYANQDSALEEVNARGYEKCSNCERRFNRIPGSKRQLTSYDKARKALNQLREKCGKTQLGKDDVICNQCYLKVIKKLREISSGSSTSDTEENVACIESESSVNSAEDVSAVSETEWTYMLERMKTMTISIMDLQDIFSTGLVTSLDVFPGSDCASSSMHHKDDKKCSSCQKKFSRTGRDSLQLVGLERIKNFLNQQRVMAGEKLLATTDFICHDCYQNALHTIGSRSPECADSGSENEEITQHDPIPPHLSHGRPLPDIPTEQATTASVDEDVYMDISDRRTTDDASTVDDIILPIKSYPHTDFYCFICKKQGSRIRVTPRIRLHIWKELNILIPYGNGICATHVDKNTKILNQRSQDDLLRIPSQERTKFKKVDLVRFIRDLSKITDVMAISGRLSFAKPEDHSDEDFECFFGIKKDAFETVHAFCADGLRNTKARSTRDAVAMLLIKLRLNLSQLAISCLFGITQQSVSIAISRVRKLLMEQFVPKNLGYKHVSREDYIDKWSTDFTKILTGASNIEAIVILDGTYFYIQKSKNYKIQRKTFSLHKFRNLIKVMMIVAPNGKILAVEGPYFADGQNNDAAIMKAMTTHADGFQSFFKAGDYIIEDRGFRDSNELMTSLGYEIRMPHFLTKGKKQHTDIEGNESRLVTKIRWVVESANGRLKNKFKFLRDVIPNTYLDDTDAFWDLFRICCALLNAFCPALKTDKPEDTEFANAMMERADMRNLLHERLVDGGFIRKTKSWAKVDNTTLVDFPKLVLSDIRRLTFGVYQIKQAPSYAAESLGQEGEYEMYWHNDLGPAGIRFEIRSRHQTSTIHSCWIAYSPNGQDYKDISGWYCQCKAGARIVGMCAHVSAIVWYLSYARYLTVVQIPARNIASRVKDAKSEYEQEYQLDEDDELEFNDLEDDNDI